MDLLNLMMIIFIFMRIAWIL